MVSTQRQLTLVVLTLFAVSALQACTGSSETKATATTAATPAATTKAASTPTATSTPVSTSALGSTGSASSPVASSPVSKATATTTATAVSTATATTTAVTLNEAALYQSRWQTAGFLPGRDPVILFSTDTRNAPSGARETVTVWYEMPASDAGSGTREFAEATRIVTLRCDGRCALSPGAVWTGTISADGKTIEGNATGGGRSWQWRATKF